MGSKRDKTLPGSEVCKTACSMLNIYGPKK